VNNLNNSGCPVIIVEPNYGNHKEIVKLELSNYYTEIIGKDVSGREYYKYEIRTAD